MLLALTVLFCDPKKRFNCHIAIIKKFEKDGEDDKK